LTQQSFKESKGYGYVLALISVLLWSGNFIIAKDAAGKIPPATLSFYRWTIAAIILTPFVYKRSVAQWNEIKKHKWHLTITAIFGITIFNTCAYIAAPDVPAIHLALFSATASPIFSIILAAIFLKERIHLIKFIGILISIAGILSLLTKGNIVDLLKFKFHEADLWILAAAISFAIYNIFVRKKPSTLHPQTFLVVVFWIGIFFLFPFFLYEQYESPTVMNFKNISSLIYLGVGASLIAYLCWNAAIRRIGAGRTALFGNLIPVFSMIEAVLILGEQLTMNQTISSVLIITGLVVANSSKSQNPGVKS
jgi:drug/metabolite transporter (DMT)-like permease